MPKSNEQESIGFGPSAARRIISAVRKVEGTTGPARRSQRQPVIGETRRFVVVTENDDTLTCKPFHYERDTPQDYDETETGEGGNDIEVAKPYELQKTPFDNAVVDMGGTLVTYLYTGSNERTASATGEDDENQFITPDYFAGTIILAKYGNTGTADCMWLDVNEAGRQWAVEMNTGGDHDHTGPGDGGKLTNDVHDGHAEFEAIALPAAAGGTARVAAVDVGGGDVRFAFVGDTGDEVYAGNGTFSSAGALGLQSVGTIDVGTDGNATSINVGTTGVTAVSVGHVSATTSVFGTLLHDGAQATLAAQSNGVVFIGGGAVVSVMRFLEGSGSGTDYVGLKAPTTLSVSQDYELPSAVATENGQLMACTTIGVLSFCGVKVDGGALQPVTNDGISLGLASTGEFSDMFGATGFTFNIANGNWVATHSSAVLEVTTGDLRVSTAGTDDNSVLTRESTNVVKNWITGLEMRYSSATAVIIAVGVARADGDTTNIVSSSEVTVSIATLQAAAGLDEKNLTGTTASNNSTTLTGTSTLFLSEFGTRNLTGTVSSSATTVTGTSTKFLSEVTVGDLIGATTASSTAKFARVTAIASDTSLTVSATLTISGGTTGVVIENCTVKHDAGGTPQPRRVDQIQSDTTVIVTSAFTGGSLSGKSARAGCEVIDTWFFPWLVSGGSGVTAILSTQRTTPFGVTGYTTSKRRIGSIRNNNAGDIIPFNQTGSDRQRSYQYEVDVAAHNTRLLSAGTATSWTNLMAHQVAPYSAHTLLTMAIVYKPGAEAAIYLRKRGVGEAAVARNLGTRSLTSDMGWTFAPCACDGAQGIDYVSTTGSGSPAYVDLVGYVEMI